MLDEITSVLGKSLKVLNHFYYFAKKTHNTFLSSVGSTWPAGVMEMRKHDNYLVRLDRSLSTVPLRAQRMALEKLRKGEAGSAANLFVQLFYDASKESLDMARGIPSHFDNDYKNDNMEEEIVATSTLQDEIKLAMDKAKSQMTFKPNTSQQEAVVWALSRTLGLIRGPPGVYLMIVCMFRS